MRSIPWLSLLVCAVVEVESGRFLAVLPSLSRSHNIWHYSLFSLLTGRGHQVVVYGCFPPPSDAKITFFEVCGFKEVLGDITYERFRKITRQTIFHDGAIALWYSGQIQMKNTFQSDKIKNLLKSNETFDVVFVEATFAQEALVVFGHKFQAPVINLQGFSSWTAVNWITGNPLSIAHIPNNRIHYGFSNNMSFIERMINFVTIVNELLMYHYDHLPKCERLLQAHYNEPSTPPLSHMLRDISLTLINSHSTLEYPRPYTPNVVPIAGAHIPYHNSPLPQEIKLFMDEAKEGLIYFSLGTAVPESTLPEKYVQAFLEAFRRLSQRVLWKTQHDDIAGLSDNVMITKWVPQPTVLAHPNCVLFITHGGLFSQHEALQAGVPVVGVPFFADQWYNVRYYESLGIGAIIKLETITEKTFRDIVTKVLADKSYRENAQRVSAIVRDKPVAPTETAVFWVEYVLRHRGAPHLRPASADLPWYQLWLLDLLAAALVTPFILYLVVKLMIRASYRALSLAKVI